MVETPISTVTNILSQTNACVDTVPNFLVSERDTVSDDTRRVSENSIEEHKRSSPCADHRADFPRVREVSRNIIESMENRADRLPEELARKVVERRANGAYRLALPDYGDLEGLMRELRAAGVHVQEMEVMQPDLEEVFVQIMQKS